jgi:transcriptional regulator with XRE-family HTH domain
LQIEFMTEDVEDQAQAIYERTFNLLLKAIKESGLTDDVIAERCGKSQAWVNRIRHGKRGRNLPFITILKLALALNIDLTTLYLSASPTQSKLKALLSEINKMIVND